MNLANEISALESELQSLRTENEVLKSNKAIIEFENESLHRQVSKVNAERDNLMRRGEAIKSLLDQIGGSLMLGLRKFHDNERDIEAARLTAETGEMPMFVAQWRGNGHAEADKTEH
ncbi:chromosome segregation ATPase [Bradyrhizobium barranii subsp. barranii]